MEKKKILKAAAVIGAAFAFGESITSTIVGGVECATNIREMKSERSEAYRYFRKNDALAWGGASIFCAGASALSGIALKKAIQAYDK